MRILFTKMLPLLHPSATFKIHEDHPHLTQTHPRVLHSSHVSMTATKKLLYKRRIKRKRNMLWRGKHGIKYLLVVPSSR